MFCEIFSVSSARFAFRYSCFGFPAEGGRLALFCEIYIVKLSRNGLSETLFLGVLTLYSADGLKFFELV